MHVGYASSLVSVTYIRRKNKCLGQYVVKNFIEKREIRSTESTK